jgi:hypothetical protein
MPRPHSLKITNDGPDIMDEICAHCGEPLDDERDTKSLGGECAGCYLVSAAETFAAQGRERAFQPLDALRAAGMPGTEPTSTPLKCVGDHEWVVFGRVMEQFCLLLECAQCGAFGTVDDPTKAEWHAAYTAPSAPYHWKDSFRVTVRSESPFCGSRHVQKA